MSEAKTELMTDEEILKGLKREAIATVAPERMRLYGDAYGRLQSLTAENERLREGIVKAHKAYEDFCDSGSTYYESSLRGASMDELNNAFDNILKEAADG